MYMSVFPETTCLPGPRPEKGVKYFGPEVVDAREPHVSAGTRI